ncbi:hypothetical protein Tco_0572449 [Tanacetum coccineum]
MSRSKTPSHLRISERLENQSKLKAKSRGERTTSRGRRFERREVGSDTKGEGDSEDSREDLNVPYKRPKPTPFTTRITRFKYHEKAKLLRNVKVYEGSKDSEDHLGISRLQRSRRNGICRYDKDPTEIYGMKRRMNEGLQAFMDWFKFESSHIKGVPPVLRISAFMHGNGHLELAKKLNDKTPNTIDEMFERVRAFTRGEATIRIYIDGGSSSEIIYDHYFKSFGADVKSKLRKANAHLVGFSSETYHPLGLIDLRVTMGESGRSKIVLLEFAIVKCRSPYNVIIGRTGMRSLGAVDLTIHLMIKFPTTKGIATMRTSKETLWECR